MHSVRLLAGSGRYNLIPVLGFDRTTSCKAPATVAAQPYCLEATFRKGVSRMIFRCQAEWPLVTEEVYS